MKWGIRPLFPLPDGEREILLLEKVMGHALSLRTDLLVTRNFAPLVPGADIRELTVCGK